MTETTDPGELFEQLDRNAKEFTVTEQHLTLLKNAYVRWDDIEYGAPAIDGKRPYGNSNVLVDIVELLFANEAEASNVDMDDYEAYEKYAEKHEPELAALHAETGMALQIALRVGEFKAGRYVMRGYGDWTLA